jgi:predicted membrane-bound spermidine synthase
VYQWVGLLIAAFMGGLGLGGWLMTRWLAQIEREKWALLALKGGLVVFWVLLPGVLLCLQAGVWEAGLLRVAQGILLLLNALAGFLVGTLFPLANRMWRRGGRAEGTAPGLLYAADLVGAFGASILVSVLLIPVMGILETCFLAALLEVSSFFLVITLPR